MASSDLTWLLVKKWNSFQVKGVPEGPVFSKEPVSAVDPYVPWYNADEIESNQGNLRNLHSNKYSGLVNAKVRPFLISCTLQSSSIQLVLTVV